MGGNYRENLFGISGQKIANCVGAFDDEGTLFCPYAPIEKKFTNARPLRTRQGEGGGCLAQRRFRPDAASAARIRWARAFARLSAVNFPLVRSCSCWSLSN
jgi:hypothetical protein